MFSLCQAVLSFEHEHNKGACSGVQTHLVREVSEESTLDEWAHVTKKEPDLGVGGATAKPCQGHTQALGCTLQLCALILGLHSDCVPSQDGGTWLRS